MYTNPMVIRVSFCKMNMGGGVGNRNVVMELMSWVDVLIVVDGSVTREDGYVDHESTYYSLVSFVEGSSVEVYVREEWLG